MGNLSKLDYLAILFCIWMIGLVALYPFEKKKSFWNDDTVTKLNLCLISSLERNNRILAAIPDVSVEESYIMLMLGILECGNEIMKSEMTKCDKDFLKSFLEENVNENYGKCQLANQKSS